MKNFNRGGRFNKDKGRDYRRRDSGRPTMHRAVCDECGKDCEVPFRPTGDKPIYCSDCFKKTEPRKSNNREFSRSSFNDKKMYRAVCDECGKDCEVPFRPTKGKPIYCNSCFGKNEKPSPKTSRQSDEQFTKLSAKLDKIIELLTPKTVKKETKKKEEKIKEPAKKKTKKKK